MATDEEAQQGLALVAETVEIPSRIWRVQYVVRKVTVDATTEEHDEHQQVIWFETESGLYDFIAGSWLSQQTSSNQQTIIKSVHRVLVESVSEVEFDVGMQVQVS